MGLVAEKTKDINVEKSSLMKNTKFVLMFLASIFTGLSFSSYMMIEQWYVLDHLGRGEMLGVIMALTALPRLIFMLFGGVFADRYSSSKTMLLSNGSRVLLLTVMIVLLQFNQLGIWSLAIFALIFGILDAYFWPANNAIIPAIVNKEILTRANSIIRITGYLSMIIGPVIAAFLIKFVSYTGAFTIIGLWLLASSVFIYFVKDKANQPAPNKNMLKQVGEGFTYLLKTKTIYVFAMIFILTNLLFIGPVALGTPLIVKNVLKADELVLGYLDGGWAIGLLLGSIITGILNLRKNRGVYTMVLLFLQGIMTLLYGVANEFWQFLVIVTTMGLCTSMVNIPIFSYVQETTKKTMLGSVMGIFTMVSNGLVPVSFLLVSTAISFQVPIDLILISCGSVIMIFCIFVVIKVKEIRTVN